MRAFFESYLNAALAYSNDESTPSGGKPLDENYTIQDLDSDTWAKMYSDCENFLMDWKDALAKAMAYNNQYTMLTAGEDFWLTRNGHGTGFWDSDLGEIGETLTEAAKSFGDFSLHLGKDRKIYGVL